MKIRRIARLRKMIMSAGYIEKRMYELADKCKSWNNFYLFKCDSFYVGDEMAYLNTKKYEKGYRRCKGKFEWYKKKLVRHEK